ncbi:Lipase (class 3) [Marivirga sericea]|uniref:Lipase (Class 3) n=2 Tax=Marivirga sericea TaxID=1028 RepID=A0A1X7L3A1_9BACT|nr:Lipase (class 3) [Marivirga sericea]
MTLRNFLFLGLFILSISCQNRSRTEQQYQQIVEEGYNLAIPNKDVQAVLILFGGYPERASDIKREFDIMDKAMNRGVAILYSNFNQKIWLSENEIEALALQMEQALKRHQLPTSNVYIGGFSSGGNVALLLGNHLAANNENERNANGVFLIDSPVDLVALYQNAERNVKRDFSVVAMEESKWLLQKFGSSLGSPETSLEVYEKHSVVTLQTSNISNLSQLKNVKLRLYTEPDSSWWKENRQADFEQTNAYQIQKLYELLKLRGFENTEYIPSQLKGYRANGDRHPHSWSIVNQDDLLDWILRS